MRKLIFGIAAISLAPIFFGCNRYHYVSAPSAPVVKLVHDTVFIKIPTAAKPLYSALNSPVDTLLASVLQSGTPNFNLRRPNFVIIHHTAQDSCAQTFRTFSLTRTKVSAHYVICRDGTVSHLLNDCLRAWHAGNSRWGNMTDVNSCSIGIELDNNGREPFTDLQIASLLKLLDTLKRTYLIPTANFIGHGDIAPSRKNDPSIFFPWKKLAENGFGYWYDESAMVVPIDPDFDPILGLRIIGYNVKDTAKAIQSFKRHFMAVEGSGFLNSLDKKAIYSLYKKYL